MRFVVVLIAALAVACSAPKKRIATTTGGSGSGSVATGSGTPTGKIPQASSEVVVIVDGKTITINGIKVSGTPQVADIEAIFGPPDRTWDKGAENKIHTWDKIGLLVYEPYDGRCVSATFPYKASQNVYTPKATFAGTIKLDGRAFTPVLDLKQVKAWPGATQPYTGTSIVFDRDEFHVFTITEPGGTPGLDLVELSFWQHPKDQPVRRPLPQRVVGSEIEEDCRGGDYTKCTSLALSMQTGANGRKNIERAFELAKLGCTGGDAFACLMIGNMYEAGRGTKVNKIEARVSWKRACTLGYKAACELK